jgi:hypothetical protein
MRQTRTVVAAICVAMASVPTNALPAQGVELSRFGNVFDVVLADTTESRPLERSVVLRYPIVERSTGVEAGFYAAFVIDTLGRVERPTITFSDDAGAPFRQSVCAYLEDVHFAPVKRYGGARRALVVTVYTFSLNGGYERWAKKVSAEPLRRVVERDGVDQVAPLLEKKPHCEQ